MQDINMPLNGSSLEFSSGIMHSYSNPKQKLVSDRDWMQHDGHGSKIDSLFGDRRNFYDRENSKEDIWDGSLHLHFILKSFIPFSVILKVAITN